MCCADVLRYMMPIIMLLIRRLRGEHISYGPWRLGKWGLPINVFSVFYSIFVSLFLFFPSFIPVSAQNFNWTVVVFFGCIVSLTLPTELAPNA